MKEYKGIRICEGTAVGQLFYYSSSIDKNISKKAADPDEELQRLELAFEKVKIDLQIAADSVRERAGEKEAAIFEARLMILEDESWISRIKNCILQEKATAEYCVLKASEKTAETFRNQSDEYLKARSEDVENLAAALVNALSGKEGRVQPGEPSIIVAEELSPEDVAFFNPSVVMGFATKKGSPISHTAILAGNLNIPFLSGIDCFDLDLKKIRMCAIDGEQNIFILEPDAESIEKYKEIAAKEKARILEIKNSGSRLISESPVKLFSNIGNTADAEAALKEGAQGIGLFRTEFLYMDRTAPPSEEEQLEIYRSVLQKMGDLPVIIRTIDIGADKKVQCVKLPEEENPALGTRGIRISFANPELFKTQMRALLRAAVTGNMKIMYPMITAEEELDELFEFQKAVVKELEEEKLEYKIPPQGIMIETPAAALISDVLAKKVDFFSVGSNDLTQYTLALDRTADDLLGYYRPHHSAILKLIEMSTQNAHKAGIEIGICGELAADPEMLPAFVDMGIDELSMSAPKIKKTAKLIAEYTEKKKEGAKIVSPVDGVLVKMEDIPDEAFSSGSMGNCIGVLPENGDVFAPCDGVISAVAETKHAFGVRKDDGEELLIHIGIDTVKLDGKCFDCDLKEGRRIEKGEKLMRFDPEGIRSAGYSPMVIVIRMS